MEKCKLKKGDRIYECRYHEATLIELITDPELLVQGSDSHYWHWLLAILFRPVFVESIQDAHNLSRVMPISSSISSNLWWSYSLVRSIEHPIRAECNICTMQSHCTRNVKAAIIYQTTELWKETGHLLNFLV